MSELTLDLASGLILHRRVVPNGIDTTVFAGRHLGQRIVYGALLKRNQFRRACQEGDRVHFADSNYVPLSTAEANVVMAFVNAVGDHT